MLKRLWPGPKDPLAWQVPLLWFDQQLPGDLLATGFHWTWESWRGGKAANPNVPEHRPPTALTEQLAPSISAELGEYDGEVGRAFTAFATLGPMELNAADFSTAMRTFAGSGGGRLLAVIHQEPEGSADFFISRKPPQPLVQLLETWASRLGKPVDSIEKRPGGPILRRVFLDPKRAAR